MNENIPSLNKNPVKEKDRPPQRAKECINKNPKHSEPQLQSSSRNDANVPSVKEQESLDDMDICTPEHEAEIVEPPITEDFHNKAPDLTLKSTSKSTDSSSTDQALPHSKEQPSVTSTTTAGGLQDEATTGKPTGTVINFKWRPLKGMSALQNVNVPPVATKNIQLQDNQTPNTQGVRMEIKSKSRVRPGSLFDEVRKTARLNQRPRNQESSSEERSPSVGNTRGTSHTRSPKKSRSVSGHRSHSRGYSHSYSRSRSRSRSSSYSSRSRSRSRRRRGRGRSRSRSSTYRSYRSHSRTYSRSNSRSHSYTRRRRSRSDSYDSYSSRSRSVSRRRGRRRSDSYRSSDRRSRSYRSSSRSSSRRRSHSRSSRYS